MVSPDAVAQTLLLKLENTELEARVAELERENKRLGDEMVARVRLQERTYAAVIEGPDAMRRLIAELEPDKSGEGTS